jgi:hypothetical protein
MLIDISLEGIEKFAPSLGANYCTNDTKTNDNIIVKGVHLLAKELSD